MTGVESDDVFERAAAYIRTEARELERARFDYHFGSGDRRPVLAALAEFQNADGGFGRALEPDMRASASSVIATCMGLGVLREVEAAADEPIAGHAIGYLLAAYDDAQGIWPIVGADVEEAPHAPWWTYTLTPSIFDGFAHNPRTEVASHLWAFRGHVPEAFLAALTDDVLDTVDALPDVMGVNDYHCLLLLLEAPGLPAPARTRVRQKAVAAAAASVRRDPAGWAGYGLLPLSAAPEPMSPLADAVGRELLETHIDYVIARQSEDGSWGPSWSWADDDPESWAAAERDWRGVLTLNMLRTLAAYGRVRPNGLV